MLQRRGTQQCADWMRIPRIAKRARICNLVYQQGQQGRVSHWHWMDGRVCRLRRRLQEGRENKRGEAKGRKPKWDEWSTTDSTDRRQRVVVGSMTRNRTRRHETYQRPCDSSQSVEEETVLNNQQAPKQGGKKRRTQSGRRVRAADVGHVRCGHGRRHMQNEYGDERDVDRTSPENDSSERKDEQSPR